MKKRLSFLFLLIMCLIVLTGCSETQDEGLSNEKCITEVEYIENAILEIYDEIALKTDVTQIDWENINKKIDLLNSAWDDTIIDMTKTNINTQDISNFSDNLNKFIIEVGNRNQVMSIYELANLYNYIPRFSSQLGEDDFETTRKEFKSSVLVACSYVKDGRWVEATDTINELSTSYNNLMNNTEYVQKYSYNLNRLYVLTEELKNSLTYNNENLFLAKYKAYIEEF